MAIHWGLRSLGHKSTLALGPRVGGVPYLYHTFADHFHFILLPSLLTLPADVTFNRRYCLPHPPTAGPQMMSRWAAEGSRAQCSGRGDETAPWEGEALPQTAQETFDSRPCAVTSRQPSVLIWFALWPEVRVEWVISKADVMAHLGHLGHLRCRSSADGPLGGQGE